MPNLSHLFGHDSLVIFMGLLALWLSFQPVSQQLDDALFGLYTQILPEEHLPEHTALITIDDLISLPTAFFKAVVA